MFFFDHDESYLPYKPSDLVDIVANDLIKIDNSPDLSFKTFKK